MHRKHHIPILLLTLVLLMAYPPSSVTAAESEDPSSVVQYKAERMFSLPGLRNVGRVAPGLYRGAQPEPEGYQTLKKMGIRTVINLRAFHSEKEAVTEAGLQSVEIPMNMLKKIDPEAVEQVVAAMAAPENQPVYVHCALGEDRTGTVVAVYRMSRQGWPLQAAFEEMQAFGFNDIWIHIRKFLETYASSQHE